MYEATGDRRYLDTFVAQADRILANRDSERGRRDSRGRSLPAWSVGDPYTVGVAVALADAAGVPVLELSSALPDAGKARVVVGAGTAPGTFRLTVWNPSRVAPEAADGRPGRPDHGPGEPGLRPRPDRRRLPGLEAAAHRARPARAGRGGRAAGARASGA